jgi:Ran GTPase-activating protein (RanGAP) involved in mRNA processing and transport
MWAICASLARSTSLQALDLRFNMVTDSEQLCDLLLEKGSRLALLRLSGNHFEPASQLALVGALRTNKSLVELELSECGLREEGLCALFKALRVNTMLARLRISHSVATTHSLEELGEMLMVNSTLHHLSLASSMVTDEGCAALARGLTANESLVGLDLSENPIELGGLRALNEALSSNYVLTGLDLDRCPCVGRPGFEALRTQILDFLGRNAYYTNNRLMRDMTQLVSSGEFGAGEAV